MKQNLLNKRANIGFQVSGSRISACTLARVDVRRQINMALTSTLIRHVTLDISSASNAKTVIFKVKL